MKIAFVAEKLSLLKHVVQAHHRVHPSAEMTIGAFATSIVGLNSRFNYPRGLKWSDYPFVGEPRYRPFYFSTGYIEPRRILKTGATLPFFDGDFVGDGEAAVRREFNGADRIVLALDPDMSGELMLDHVVRSLEASGVDRSRFRRVRLWDLTQDSIDMAIEKAEPYQPDDRDLRAARLRRHFDYNFDVNAMAILNKAYGIASETPVYASKPISKHMLQMLYAVRRNPGLNEGRLVELMKAWKGTGKHRAPDWYRGSLFGSEASRGQIVANCRENGLISTSGVGIHLSEHGRAFLDVLHPDTEDPDLPFRLAIWAGMPEEEAVPRIDRYIRTVFGKNKRRVDAMPDPDERWRRQFEARQKVWLEERAAKGSSS